MNNLAMAYPPIVDPEIWWENLRKLHEVGLEKGTRGVPKCPHPNKYPLQVSAAHAAR